MWLHRPPGGRGRGRSWVRSEAVAAMGEAAWELVVAVPAVPGGSDHSRPSSRRWSGRWPWRAWARRMASPFVGLRRGQGGAVLRQAPWHSPGGCPACRDGGRSPAPGCRTPTFRRGRARCKPPFRPRSAPYLPPALSPGQKFGPEFRTRGQSAGAVSCVREFRCAFRGARWWGRHRFHPQPGWLFHPAGALYSH